jgi:O-methyltransferase involved in polyketide biosynthesis
MQLPPELTWIEADLPPLVEEKEKAFAGEKPVCSLTRERVDLADASARRDLLDRATRGAKAVVVLTEGLLVYLDEGTVRDLADDMRSRRVRYWIADVASPGIVRMMKRGMGRHLENAPMKFAPPEGLAFFEKLGWNARDCESIFHEAIRLHRLPLLLRFFSLFFPRPNPRRLGERTLWSGLLRLEAQSG